MKRLPKKGRWRYAAKIKAKLEHTRQCFTYVAIICSDPEIQKLLPQVILVKADDVNWETMNRLWELLPNNVFLKRKKSAWNSNDDQVEIISILGKVLAPFQAKYQPVLIFDAVKIHLSDAALEEIFDNLMWYMVVPKEMTYALQALDTHAFGTFKSRCRRHYNNCLGRHDYPTPTSLMVSIVIQVIETWITDRDWTYAFKENGFGSLPRLETRSYLKNQCGWEEEFPIIVAKRPTSLQLQQYCWPQDFPFHSFQAFLAFPMLREPMLALPMAAPPPPPALPPAAAPLLALPAPPIDDTTTPTLPASPTPIVAPLQLAQHKEPGNTGNVATAKKSVAVTKPAGTSSSSSSTTTGVPLMATASSSKSSTVDAVAKKTSSFTASGILIIPSAKNMSSLPTKALHCLKSQTHHGYYANDEDSDA